jgi:hypothetical protein
MYADRCDSWLSGRRPEIPKRFSDFLSLKRQLKLAGRDRFKSLFPGRHVDLSPISDSMSRASKLQQW